jgi:Protein of unknown function (DUF2911)
MQSKTRILWTLGLSAGVLSAGGAAAAPAPPTAFEVPATNSPAVVHQQVAATEIEVSYHRPSVKGRKIFGELVRYDQVWRTGADNATRISFSTPVSLNGTPLDAGEYELFTVPGEKEWTVIFHENRSQWGSYSYDPAHDVARIQARPVALPELVETFTISVDDVHSAGATLNISWERTRVPVRVEIDVRATVVPRLEEALQGEGRHPYFQAAMFYFENDLELARAAELMELALERSPGHIGMLYRLGLILERKGDIPGAIAAAEASLSGAAAAAPELKQEYTRLDTALLDRLRSTGG